MQTPVDRDTLSEEPQFIQSPLATMKSHTHVLRTPLNDVSRGAHVSSGSTGGGAAADILREEAVGLGDEAPLLSRSSSDPTPRPPPNTPMFPLHNSISEQMAEVYGHLADEKQENSTPDSAVPPSKSSPSSTSLSIPTVTTIDELSLKQGEGRPRAPSDNPLSDFDMEARESQWETEKLMLQRRIAELTAELHLRGVSSSASSTTGSPSRSVRGGDFAVVTDAYVQPFPAPLILPNADSNTGDAPVVEPTIVYIVRWAHLLLVETGPNQHPDSVLFQPYLEGELGIFLQARSSLNTTLRRKQIQWEMQYPLPRPQHYSPVEKGHQR